MLEIQANKPGHSSPGAVSRISTLAADGVRTSTPSPATGKEERAHLMNTVVNLNKMMCEKSKDCRMLFVNLPTCSPDVFKPGSYLQMLEALTDKFPRAVLVHGSGSEVVTLYS
jgi:hypothetical protein